MESMESVYHKLLARVAEAGEFLAVFIIVSCHFLIVFRSPSALEVLERAF